MASSLIPERALQVSPSLAATIGLEEACMLAALSDIAAWRPLRAAQGHHWLDVDEATVEQALPFWNSFDIQRISRSLQDKGVILIASGPYTETRQLSISFASALGTQNTPNSSARALPIVNMGAGANLIAANWQPDPETLKAIGQHNIPEEFAYRQLPEFVTYWRERGETSHSWGAKFLKDVLHKWRHHQTQVARQQREAAEPEADFLRRDQDLPMHGGWRPSQDALEVLVKHASINLAFVEDAIPEFVVYWQERGEVGRTWNSKFIQHVKRQWVRFTSTLEHDTEPKRLPDQWQPSAEVFDVLQLANIDLNFARQQVPEFVLFWRESNQLYSSWNTKFLQHVKYHWAKQHALQPVSQPGNTHAGQQSSASTTRTRDRGLAEQINDRSWAN